MLFITGDTHIPIDIGKLSSKRFPEQKGMTKNDYVIICGDFGGVWDDSSEEKYWIKWLKNKNFTTLFVDGNHENFDMLYTLPTVVCCGGIAHKVDEGIYHLIRGEVYNIDKKSFFVFGGASSHDKEHRTEGKSWWKDEMPSEKEYENAKTKLLEYNYEFDYIITHCAPGSIQNIITQNYESNELTMFLDAVKNKSKYIKWYFGHYHQDKSVDEKHIALFNSIHKI